MEMRSGDTMCLLLNYTINGSPMVQGAYREIELQINTQGQFNSIKKLLSDNSIEWGTITYIDDSDMQQSFTGYYAKLTQEDTFKITSGQSQIQLRVMINDEVGSSAISDIDLGNVLSRKVLGASTN